MADVPHQHQARGAAEVVRFLADHGHRHDFGIPGNSMVSLLHELQSTSITHVPIIHESVAVAADDVATLTSD